MTIGDKVRASFPYGGVPACAGKIIKAMVVGQNTTQFLVNFEIRPGIFKKFYLYSNQVENRSFTVGVSPCGYPLRGRRKALPLP